MINKLTLIGRIGNVDISDNPKAPIKFSVATTRSYKDKNSDKWIENTDWHNCNLFTGKDRYKDKLAKGQLVYVEASLNYNKYTNKEGIEVTGTNINCSYIRVLDWGKNAADELSDISF